ncbi:MAG: ribosome silencing factor, partial [Candidatus Melainabacteria bacterium]|nr:ribosome silencing factor [Candidatus Melainabacteria bacterium]
VLADYFVIVAGESPSQVKAIVDAVDGKLEPLGCKALGVEGKSESRWVLLDYGDVIVHVLHEKERGYYKLEQFWNQALMVDRSEWEQEE